jgi:hypothetical protein
LRDKLFIERGEKEMGDFLTNLSDSEILSKAEFINDKISEISAASALPVEVLDELSSDTNELKVDVGNHISAQNHARSMTKKKDVSIKKVKKTLRTLARKLENAGASKTDLIALSMRRSSEQNLSQTWTRPRGIIDTSQRFTHTIRIFDENTPETIRKPRGVSGCEVYVKIGGDAPVGLSDCKYQNFTRKSIYRVEYDGENIGKQAHYIFRWHITDDSVSPISPTASATITG